MASRNNGHDTEKKKKVYKETLALILHNRKHFPPGQDHHLLHQCQWGDRCLKWARIRHEHVDDCRDVNCLKEICHVYWDIYTHYYMECLANDRCVACQLPPLAEEPPFEAELLHAQQVSKERNKSAVSGHSITDQDIRAYLRNVASLAQSTCNLQKDYPYQSRASSSALPLCVGCMKDKIAPVRRCSKGPHWILADVYKKFCKSMDAEMAREEYGDEEVGCEGCIKDGGAAVWKEFPWDEDAQYVACPKCDERTGTYWMLEASHHSIKKYKKNPSIDFQCNNCINKQKGWRLHTKLKWEPLCICRGCDRHYHMACGLLMEPYMVCAQCRLDKGATYFGAGLTSCEGGRLEQFLHARLWQRFHSHFYFVRQLESYVGEVSFNPDDYSNNVQVPDHPIVRIVRKIALVSQLSGMPSVEFIMCVSEYWHECGHSATKGCVN